MDITKFTEKEFQESLDEIYLTYTKGIKILDEKKAFLLGGQPGAGKSGLTTILKSDEKNLIVINGDDFRKEHPHYKELEEKYGKESVEYTKTFAGKMTETLIDKLSDEGYSLIVEGTLRTTEVPLKTQKKLSEKGYNVELDVIQVKPEFSYLGTLNRYEEMIKRGLQPRATLKKDHDIVVDNIANNLTYLYKEKVFSNIRLFNRNGDCLYSMKQTPEIDPGVLLDKEFKRDLKKDEIESLENICKKILENMNNRNATLDEISIIQNEIKYIQKINNINKAPYNALTGNEIAGIEAREDSRWIARADIIKHNIEIQPGTKGVETKIYGIEEGKLYEVPITYYNVKDIKITKELEQKFVPRKEKEQSQELAQAKKKGVGIAD